ncbi:heavy-metal-associated domain-containing protein, partial [Staphylococcus pasteuri_A]
MSVQTWQLNVAGLNCQGCVSKVRLRVQGIDTDAIVEGLPDNNQMTITSHLSEARLLELIEELGFRPLA